MVKLLAKFYIKENDDAKQQRQKYGLLCGALGIALNLLLFAGKFFAGTISKSVAITADAFNNLSDAGSSVITLIGFKLAGQKPDAEHPFGHGRMEYLSGLAVSVAILFMGFELVKSSISKIIHPEAVQFSILSCAILAVSIAVKLYMSFYNRKIGDQIDSAAMRATASDSFSDSIATAVVLVASVVGHYTGIMIDGWCGLLVSFFIFKAGWEAAKETISPLLGQKPSEEFVNEIYTLAMSYPEVLGIHDLVVHDYGPSRVMVTLHAEVSADADILYTHDVIDNLELEIKDSLGCETCIHMDPIAQNDEKINDLKAKTVAHLANCLGNDISIHDFRMVEGHTHTNLVFDVVVSYDIKMTDLQVQEIVKNCIKTMDDGRYRAVVTVDHQFV